MARLPYGTAARIDYSNAVLHVCGSTPTTHVRRRVCVCVCVLRRLQITAYCRAARHTAGVQLRGRFAFTTHVPELPADYGKR